MKRQLLPIEALPAWIKLNGISFRDVEVKRMVTDDGIDKGAAVLTTCAKESKEGSSEPEILMAVPRDLVLSLDLVHTCAKSDRYLREVLEAMGEFGKVSIEPFPITIFVLLISELGVTGVFTFMSLQLLFLIGSGWFVDICRQPAVRS